MKTCKLPPKGWRCTRTPGHDGPCAPVAQITPLTMAEINEKIARRTGRILYVIRKPMHDPYGYFREGASGYTNNPAEAWHVTAEVGAKHEYLEDLKPDDAGYNERVILEPAPIADYCGSLDLMHEEWKTLTPGQHETFRFALQRIVWIEGHVEGPCRSCCNATSYQRARAFISIFDAVLFAEIQAGDLEYLADPTRPNTAKLP